MAKIKFDRRTVLKTGAAGGAAVVAGSLFMPAVHAQASTKIGYVTPATGPLAAFAEADEFVLGNVRAMFAAQGIEMLLRIPSLRLRVQQRLHKNLSLKVSRWFWFHRHQKLSAATASVCEESGTVYFNRSAVAAVLLWPGRQPRNWL